MDLNIETAPLDDSCKAVLRKLIDNGFDKAGVSYVTEPSVVSLAEFSSLMRNGYRSIDTPNGWLGGAVLASYEVPNVGPNVGKISFRLNFNLV
ncbi:hypothetical protein [Paraburkholderia sediminicola]|uniref:hypothetical protein n=1 Tax=Paraburkholderia sediminicola TaxID=458836 RepID=UPI0038B6C94F